MIAIAADHPVEDSALPVFALDDVEAIADFIEERLGPLKPSCRGSEAARPIGEDHA